MVTVRIKMKQEIKALTLTLLERGGEKITENVENQNNVF